MAILIEVVNTGSPPTGRSGREGGSGGGVERRGKDDGGEEEMEEWRKKEEEPNTVDENDKKSEGLFTQRDSHMPEACESLFSVAHDFNP